MTNLKKNKKKISFGPVITILILTFVIMFASLILSRMQFSGKIDVDSATPTVVNNFFTLDGLSFLFGNIMTNFQLFEPLIVLIIALIGISIGESSGLFDIVFAPLKKVNNKGMIMLTLLVGIISSIIGDYNYMFLIPLTGVIYKITDKDAFLGIITLFIGMTMGYGAGIFYNNLDYILGNLTEAAALGIDSKYSYSMLSNIYIMSASTILLIWIGTNLIEKYIVPKLPKRKVYEHEERVMSKKALYASNMTFIVLLALLVYMVVPGFPNSGLLLDNNSNEYINMLLGDLSPFRNGLIYIITIILMICGFVYGKISGNIKDTSEFSLGLSKSFNNVGFVFVLMFFTSQMISILNWTNIGPIVVANLTDFLATLPLSGIPLIVVFFFIVIIMTIILPSTFDKWMIISPTVVPLFMRANITPDFTSFIYRVADGVGKCFSPLFIYYIIMLAFLEKYNGDEENKVTVFGTIKNLMPVCVLMGLLWLIIIICWYLVGLPSGIGSYPTL